MKIDFSPNIAIRKPHGARVIDDATRDDLQEILDTVNWETSEAVVLLGLFAEEGRYIQLSYQYGEATLTYGDGQNEYWTIDTEQEPLVSTVTRQQAIDALFEFCDGGESWKTQLNWFFFQEQNPSGCLVALSGGLLLAYILANEILAF